MGKPNLKHPFVSEKQLEKIRRIRESVVELPENPFFPQMNEKLRDYQKVGVASLLFAHRMVVGDDTGLGKTVMTLAALALLFDRNLIDNAIIFTNGSSLLQWEEEVYKFTTDIEVVVLGSASHGTYTTKQRLKALENPKPIVIAPYSLITPNKNHLIHKKEDKKRPKRMEAHVIQEIPLMRMIDDRTVIVFDEATAVKNTASGRSKVAHRIAFNAGRVWGLTATVIKNNVQDIYGVFKVIYPGLLGTKTSFMARYAVQESIRNSWRKKIIGGKNLSELKFLIEPFYISRRKQDVATDLPEISIIDVPVELYDYQWWFYAEVEKKLFERNDGKVSEITPLTLAMYYQELANTPALLGYKDKSAKADRLIMLLQTDFRATKVVVFTRFKQWVNILEQRLKKEGIDNVRITGDESVKERADSRRTFSDTDCRVCLITAAGSEAINLQAADTLIFLDFPLTPGAYYQTIGRIHRIGSKSEKIWIYHMVGVGTIDEIIREKLKNKFEVASNVADIKQDVFDSMEYRDMVDEYLKKRNSV